MAQANVKLTVDATSATRALQGVQNQTNQLQKAFGGLKTALLGIGFVAVTKNIVSTTVEYQKLEQRLKVLANSFLSYDLDDIYMVPALRAYIEQFRSLHM